ncbi:hypothetical protein QZH41_006104 [Actinostola sp. cb2023]|nr:hypothetical protein QZH41_006104 [Actinostola sp. cb2023]
MISEHVMNLPSKMDDLQSMSSLAVDESIASRSIIVFSKLSAKIEPDTINLSVQDTRAMVARVQKVINVECVEGLSDGTFVMSGSYEQIVKCHGILCQLLSQSNDSIRTRRVVNRQTTSDQERKVIETHSRRNEAEEGKKKVYTERKKEFIETEKASAHEQRRQKSAKDVEIVSQETHHDKATKDMMTCMKFALVDEQQMKELRKAVLEINKMFPVTLERAPDRQSWQILGELTTIEEILQILEGKIKIKRLDPRSDDQTDDDDVDVDDDTNDNGKDNLDDGNSETDDHSEYDDDDDDSSQKLEHDLGYVKVSVYRGDITDENSDAIVNAANQHLSHDAGVAKAIVSKGGSPIQDECRRIVFAKGEIKTGEAIITHSGNLNCKMVIHAVGPNWNGNDKDNDKALLAKACMASLQQAEKYGFKSIAFPAISSGINGMSKNVCAKIMFDVVEEYNNSTPPSRAFKVNDVRFVNNDVKTVNIFQREFRARYGQGKVRLEPELTRKTISSMLDRAKHVDGLSDGSSNQQATWRKEESRGRAISMISSQASPVFQSYDDSSPYVSWKLLEPQSERPSHRQQSSHSNPSKASKTPPNPYYKASTALSNPSKASKTPSSPYKAITTPPNPSKASTPPNPYKTSTTLISPYKASTKSSPMLSGGYGGARPKQKSSQGTGHEQDKLLSSKKRFKDDPECPICLTNIRQPKTLPKCKHTFCKRCLDEALRKSPKCPLCRDPVRSRHIGNQPDGSMPVRSRHIGNQPDGSMPVRSRHIGNQPDGSMIHRDEQFSLPGYEQYGTIVIQYSFNGGIQGPDHPNPGQRLVFTVGRSITLGMDNQIVWGDIPHKTFAHNGGNYGYPDQTYLSEVQQILKAMLTR